MRLAWWMALGLAATLIVAPTQAAYVNFESSQIHPIALDSTGTKLLVVNTPDARLEVFDLAMDGSLIPSDSIPVGLEPVSVISRLNTSTGREEAWVVNHLSDSVDIVDLTLGRVIRTLRVGDEPTAVVFAQGKAFVAVSQLDLVRVYDLSNLSLPPSTVELFGRDVRALAVSNDGTKVYAVVLQSGNQTSVVLEGEIFGGGLSLDTTRLNQLGLNEPGCQGPAPSYPPPHSGITRNPALIDPPGGVPPVGLIVRFNNSSGDWEDENGQDWSNCLAVDLPDHDLFIIDAVNPTTVPVVEVDHLGTSLFDVSVHPNGKIYVPHTEARNDVRFEHPLGVQGHMVDNRFAVIDPSSGNSVTLIDLNTHINRASNPSINLVERAASISQPGMMAWKGDGSLGYLTAIGSRKLFVVDGTCLAGGCIFGTTRSTPQTVDVGEGPTGVALHEGKNRLYVLLRFSNSVAVVDSMALTKLNEVSLHDPTPAMVRSGRRFLYDGIDTSGHGDAACASCHLSGNMDGLAWDLGDPTGTMAAYTDFNDNVRFIVPIDQDSDGLPDECDPAVCASHLGFDPQKGPMTTQTLRAMLEPLHWRGDRKTLRAFNKAFVGLMGTADIGPIDGEPAGITAPQMELFRDFSLAVRMPPNPYRNPDDTYPGGCSNDPQRFCNTTSDCVSPGTCLPAVQPPGLAFAGDPGNGETLFNTHPSDAGQPCQMCHTHPFGAAGGQLGGVEPAEPTGPMASALFNGNADGSPHSDLEVPHLRNMYEKFGPTFGPKNGGSPPPESKTGFGYTHDGAIPGVGTFLSASVFNLTAAQVRDLSAFQFMFPTETKPGVGRQLTVSQGTPPTGTAGEEALLTTLLSVGNLTDGNRHCELVAAAPDSTRLRTYYLNGGAPTGSWTTDVAAEPQVSTADLRTNATGELTFLCVPLGEGVRLGADLDEDLSLNGDDCAPGDGGSFSPVQEVSNLLLTGGTVTDLSWDEQATATGTGVVYDVVGGDLSAMRASGLSPATACVEAETADDSWTDPRPGPNAGDGFFYLLRSKNACATSTFGVGRASIDPLTCIP